jgi:hypothetical protein
MKNIVVLYTVIAALGVLLALSLLRRSAKPLVDPATAALIDSLQQTHQADSVRIDLATARAAALSRAADPRLSRRRPAASILARSRERPSGPILRPGSGRRRMSFARPRWIPCTAPSRSASRATRTG